MDAPTPPEQERRLAALEGYDLLDTGPEEPFEHVVDLLTRLCDVPVALVSLVDAQRQWFKARRGLEAAETPISQSICAHAILGRDILEIEDTSRDLRTSDNPLCIGDGRFRFYAGAPLITPDGQALGSLCVLDFRPRRLSDTQRMALRVLADQVMAQIRLRQALRTQDTMRREVDHRVGNSLQMLSALARHESRRAENPETKDALERFGLRIGSVAAVHEQLYRNEAGHIVALDAYLENLARQLSKVAPPGVTVMGQAEKIGIGWRDASLIGTLFNEAVTNAFKYAFPGDQPGKVRYDVGLHTSKVLRFVCEDDGIGIGGAVGRSHEGLGTTLGKVIGLELSGDLKVEPTPRGTRVLFEFEPGEVTILSAG